MVFKFLREVIAKLSGCHSCGLSDETFAKPEGWNSVKTETSGSPPCGDDMIVIILQLAQEFKMVFKVDGKNVSPRNL